MPKTSKKIFIALVILIIIGVLRIDTVLIGENYIWTAFFILLGLGLMFKSMEERDEEIELKNEESKMARAEVDNFKKRLTEKYGLEAINKIWMKVESDTKEKELSKLSPELRKYIEQEEERRKDPRSYDPFYISDAYNPNRPKMTKDGNGDGDDKN